jgi:hypothetical protein
MLVAIGIYVGTNDLSMVPSGRQKQMRPVAGFHELRIDGM